MITSKPKSVLQFALFSLLAVLYGITFVLMGYVVSGTQSLWLYAGVVIAVTLAILFTVKLLMSYKTLIIDKEKITIKYLFRTYHFDSKALASWEEIEIKTFNNQVFRQVELIFGKVKVSFSEQEHTDYEKLLQFLKKRKR